MKTLLLMRHAKSSWDKAGQPDIERPLNDRGRREVPAMGERLAKRNIFPDMIMSSPAERAIHTATIIAPYLKMPASRIVRTEELYMASADVFLSLVQLCDDNVDTLMLVSHNPGITQFAAQLTDSPIDHMPTAAIFIAKFNVKAWHEATPGMGDYVAFEYPQKY